MAAKLSKNTTESNYNIAKFLDKFKEKSLTIEEISLHVQYAMDTLILVNGNEDFQTYNDDVREAYWILSVIKEAFKDLHKKE